MSTTEDRSGDVGGTGSVGLVDAAATSFVSVSTLASALRRAEAAHVRHERRTGQRDDDRSDWYAGYTAAGQAGTELPT